jgi:arsenite transporter
MTKESQKMAFFERYLSLWVGLSILVGILIGHYFSSFVGPVSQMTLATVNIPVAILVWFMIFPMMVQIDFTSLTRVWKSPKGLALTVFVNWLIKPFSMAFLGWLFFTKVYQGYLDASLAQEYLAGAILLGAAPCTAMVFVWSYLTKGDPEYTLIQVSINDLILVFAFIPIVKWLLGVSQIVIPMNTLLTSVIVFVVIPLIAGVVVNYFLVKRKGAVWFKDTFLPKLKPISIFALLSTLVLLFSFQGKIIIDNPIHIVLIAIPLTLQTYFIFFFTWSIGRGLKLPHCILSPGAMIGASNFFELAVAVAIALFGLNSGAALATVVGVLIEVPIMLSLVRLANKWRY